MATDESNTWKQYLTSLDDHFRERDSSLEVSAPFSPWCGNAYWNANPRILFVGKSVGASHEEGQPLFGTSLRYWKTKNTCSAATTQKYIDDQIRTYQPVGNQFWMIPFLIAGGLLGSETPEDQVIDSVAWTNLYKANYLVRGTDERGKPNEKYELPPPRKCKKAGKECRCEDCVSSEWLVREIEILNPHVLLFGICDRWDRFAGYLDVPQQLAFPTDVTDDLRSKVRGATNLKSAWCTYHFSAWSQNFKHGTLLLQIRKALAGVPKTGNS